MKATVLIDNLAKDGLKGEWGLSFYIEHKAKKLLLDTGASYKFAENAAALGLELSDVDYAVLSHAHYDHANGMPHFFNINSKASFYLNEKCRENCFGKRFIFRKYIGIKKGVCDTFKSRIRFCGDRYELFKGAVLLSHSTEGLEKYGIRNQLFKKESKRLVPDNFDHEQSLVLECEKGLVIFNSCSHGGADNIIRETALAFPGRKIYALIGGFHLYRCTDEEVKALAQRIKETGIEKIYTGHCTGDKAFRLLKQELGDKAAQLYSGMVIEF